MVNTVLLTRLLELNHKGATVPPTQGKLILLSTGLPRHHKRWHPTTKLASFRKATGRKEFNRP